MVKGQKMKNALATARSGASKARAGAKIAIAEGKKRVAAIRKAADNDARADAALGFGEGMVGGAVGAGIDHFTPPVMGVIPVSLITGVVGGIGGSMAARKYKGARHIVRAMGGVAAAGTAEITHAVLDLVFMDEKVTL